MYNNLLILQRLRYLSHSPGKLPDRRFVPLVVPMQNAVEDDSVPGNDIVIIVMGNALTCIVVRVTIRTCSLCWLK